MRHPAAVYCSPSDLYADQLSVTPSASVATAMSTPAGISGSGFTVRPPRGFVAGRTPARPLRLFAAHGGTFAKFGVFYVTKIFSNACPAAASTSLHRSGER